MSTTQASLKECNRCRDAGFPGTMISFVENGVNRTTGKKFWDLKNSDRSVHIHKQIIEAPLVAQTKDELFNIQQVEKSKQIQELHQENISTWRQQTVAVKEQTAAIKEQTKSINDLVGAIWELVQKHQ